MSLIVYVVGGQCCGKTTLLNKLSVQLTQSPLSDQVKVCHQQIARDVQTRLGFSNLKDAVSTTQKLIAFQEVMLERFIRRDEEEAQEALEQGFTAVVMERSPYDLAIYTKEWVARLPASPILQNWLIGYQERIIDYMKSSYYQHRICFLKQLPFFNEEPNRADAESAHRVSTDLYKLAMTNSRFELVDGVSPEARASALLKQLPIYLAAHELFGDHKTISGAYLKSLQG